MHDYSAEEVEGKDIKIFAPLIGRKPLTVNDIASMKRWKR
jgi:hypothetical protein